MSRPWRHRHKFAKRSAGPLVQGNSLPMTNFSSFAELRAICLDLPSGHSAASAAVAQREASLTKPPRSLGRLEDIVAWLAHWQGHAPPRLDRVDILVFAGNHGVTKLGVSAYPAEVTAQMVANFAAGGAAINQLARTAAAQLRVIPLALDQPTADFTKQPAMSEGEFLAAVSTGYQAVSPESDLICVGEMGIGNTTAAAAIAAALFGGGGARWAGRGTGVDHAGLARKQAVIDQALARHAAALAARRRGIPVLLDGFVSTAAVAPLARLNADAIRHALAGHASAEAGHRRLLEALGLVPLLDLGMRLGEGSGAAVAVLLLRAALACHAGMATFAEAQVSNKSDDAHAADADAKS